MRQIDMSTRRLANRRRTSDLVRPIAIASVALIATAIGACSSSTSPGSAAPSAPPIATSPGQSHRGSACPTQLVVTPADNSRTLCVAKGGTVAVTAQPDQAQGWTPFDVSGAALIPSSAAIPPVRNGQILAAFSAVAPGTSTVASSHRNCPSNAGGVACHSILLWQVTVVVK